MQQAEMYCALLEDLKKRLQTVRAIAAGTMSLGEQIADHEVAALNFRKILELIAFGSLCANKPVYAAAYAKFRKEWNAKRLLKNIEKIHPSFYPKPVRQEVVDEGPPRRLHFHDSQESFLTRDEFVTLYGVCSKLLHTSNPFAPDTTATFLRSLSDWVSRIEALLSLHFIQLAGTDEVWVVELSPPENGKATAHIGQPVPVIGPAGKKS